MRAKRQPGQVYRPRVRVIKVRKGRPTIVEIGGERYVWMPRDMYMGPRCKEGNGHGQAAG